MDELRRQLHEAIRQVFDDDAMQLSDETTAAEVEGWDSLMHVSLIIALEKRFGIRFATAEISALRDEGANLGTMLGLIRRKLTGV